MKTKILTIIFGIILLLGVVNANNLSNVVGIDISSNAVAGDTFNANFSFDYLADGINEDNSPLIIKLNFTSNETSYPVWKGDFEIQGIIQTCTWTIMGLCINPQQIDFTCSEEETQTIVNPLDTTTIQNVENGTFYCYNSEGDLKLNEHDEVFLNITSNPALYPTQYNLTAEMFYLTDTTNPIVQILNKNNFEKYYKTLNNIEVIANIADGRGIKSANGKIITATQNISLERTDPEGTNYTFTKIIPSDLAEGDYLVNITAEDNSGNIGSDNVTLKIDLTAPTIELVSPENDSIYDEIIPLKLKVTDEKAGVNESSVYYRLREIVNGVICPEYGVPLGNYSCARTDWINIELNSTNLYEQDVNTTELGLNSGEYWLEVKANDLLNNGGNLE